MRRILMLVGFALVVSACGGAGGSESTVSTAPSEAAQSTAAPTSDAAATTSGPSASESEPTSTSATPAEQSFDGPPAPDFELTLADGSTFTLAGEQKPVYMVFWAEW
jgi:cytochrome oxidase Cu insertion factor (SCO1/SenC/PrrC family)